MIIAAHQLHYLPWLRYFHKIATCDAFVVMDNIQFNKNGWQNRNKIKTQKGWAYLTAPVFHRQAQSLSDVQIDNKSPWARKHWGNLVSSYARAPYFKEHEPFFKKIYESKWDKLNDLNYAMLEYFIDTLGIKTKIIKSSSLNLQGEATERLVAMCKDFGASAYLTGSYAAEVYLESKSFEDAGIKVVYQEFECPHYSQLFPEAGFIPELSILDLLFNCGSKSLDVLLQGSLPGLSKTSH